MTAGDVIPLLNAAVNSTSAQYLTWRMLLKSMWYLLDVYDQQIENYSKVSGVIYDWLSVSKLNVSSAAVEALPIKNR